MSPRLPLSLLLWSLMMARNPKCLDPAEHGTNLKAKTDGNEKENFSQGLMETRTHALSLAMSERKAEGRFGADEAVKWSVSEG